MHIKTFSFICYMNNAGVASFDPRVFKIMLAVLYRQHVAYWFATKKYFRFII